MCKRRHIARNSLARRPHHSAMTMNERHAADWRGDVLRERCGGDERSHVMQQWLEKWLGLRELSQMIGLLNHHESFEGRLKVSRGSTQAAPAAAWVGCP
jgi:hypothetical protein